MLVNGKNLTTIWFDKSKDEVKIIDQRLLPHDLKILILSNLDEAIYAIKEMQVRGAPLIGVTAAFGMYLASKNNSEIENLIESGKKLKATRPTAVNLAWAVDKIITAVHAIDKKNRTDTILELANKIRQDDINACNNIGENGLKLIEDIYNKKNQQLIF